MKTAVVTGANRGIGLEIANQLAARGFHVIATGRDLEKTERAMAGISGKVSAYACDVSHNDSCLALCAAQGREITQLDVLVNNAGILDSSSALDFDLEQIKAGLDTNLLGAIQLTGALWPLLVKSSDARIVNISTGMAETASMQSGSYAPYRLSKWALNGWTMLLAAEAPGDIRVNAMCPGWVRTDMGGAAAPRPVKKGAETAVWLATEADIPHGKFLRDKKAIDW